MQVTGTIRSIVPTQAGGYQSQNGYIYTFDMVVDSPQGTYNGEIGAKSQMYPLGPGQPITVEVTETQHGPRLKKVNPQYAGQQGQPTHLTPEIQQQINEARGFGTSQGTAGQQIQDRMGGPAPAINATPTQQEYAAKEREKVLGMCFTNLLAGRLSNTPAVELEQDMAEIAAIWRLSAMCIDGTGRVAKIPDF